MPKLICITSLRDGFRRGGLRHPKTPTDHPADAFTAEQIAALKVEPMLIVAEVNDAAAGKKGENGKLDGKPGGKPDDLTAAVVEAIGKLRAAGNPDHFTEAGKGKPKVDALEAVLSYEISASDRDAAWDVIQAEAETTKAGNKNT